MSSSVENNTTPQYKIYASFLPFIGPFVALQNVVELRPQWDIAERLSHSMGGIFSERASHARSEINRKIDFLSSCGIAGNLISIITLVGLSSLGILHTPFLIIGIGFYGLLTGIATYNKYFHMLQNQLFDLSQRIGQGHLYEQVARQLNQLKGWRSSILNIQTALNEPLQNLMAQISYRLAGAM